MRFKILLVLSLLILNLEFGTLNLVPVPADTFPMNPDSEILRPVGDRAGTQWTAYPSGDKWDCINDTTPNEDTNYVWTKTVYQNGGWYHSDFTASNNIDSVRLTIRAKSPTTSGTPQIVFGRQFTDGEFWYWCTYDDGTDTSNLTSSYTEYSCLWTKDPYDNASWNEDNLNNTDRAWTFKCNALGTSPDSFGSNSGTNVFNEAANYVSAMKFTSGSGGTLTNLRLLIEDNSLGGNVKMGIYTDSSGYPKTKLWADETGQAQVNSWNSVSTGSVPISSNTDYWLCFRYSAICSTSYEVGPTASHRSRTLTYTNAWPSSFDNSWTYTNTTRYVMKAILSVTQDNKVTQSFITVYYQTEGTPAKRRSGIVQDEESRGIIEGGIAR